MSDLPRARLTGTGTVTYGEPAAAGGLTLVVYDDSGVERFRSPIRVEKSHGWQILVATRPCPEGFTAHSYAVIDDAGAVVITGELAMAVNEGLVFNLPILSTSSF